MVIIEKIPYFNCFEYNLKALSVSKASVGSQSFAELSVGNCGWRLDRKILYFQSYVWGKSRECVIEFVELIHYS